MNCEEFRKILTQEEEPPEDEDKVKEWAEHMMRCPDCRAWRNERLKGVEDLLESAAMYDKLVEVRDSGRAFTEEEQEAIRRAFRKAREVSK